MKDAGDFIKFLKQKDYVMINNHLGRGAFGETVLLKDPYIDELFVAKKYCPLDFFTEDKKIKFYQNFIDEIKILHKLNHPNVVRIYNYYAFEEFHTGYILMEYIEGDTLENFIHDYSSFSSTTLDDLFIQLIDGFAYIEYKKILHRDIRENNILVDKSGVVKIIDFGIGKIFSKTDTPVDSLVSQVNRANADTLPAEYYSGVYTSQTDMFYLAELFNRLMKNCEQPEMIDFSYQSILDKMMKKQPSERYESFLEIKMAINKHDFISMSVSAEDKQIYQLFADSLYNSLDSFINERKFNSDISIFISTIERCLANNLFEDVIQNPEELLKSIIVSGFSYSTRYKIKTEVVRKFIHWFKEATSQSQKLIINNLITKLSRIKIEYSGFDDIPF